MSKITKYCKKIFPSVHTALNKKGFTRYFKNTSWVLAEKIVRILLGMTVGIWVIKYLGPKDFGNLSYAESFIDLFGIFAIMGLGGVLVREIASREHQQKALLGTSFVLSIIGASAVFVLIIVITFFLDNSAETNLLIYIIGFTLHARSFVVINSYFQGHVLYKYIMYAHITSLVLCSILRVFLIFYNFPVVYFALTILLDMVITVVLSLYFYTKMSGSIMNWNFDLTLAKKLLKNSWPYVFSGMVISLYAKIDQIMLKEMLNSTAVGYYAAATKIGNSCHAIPGIVVASLFPAIINAKAQSQEKYALRVQKLYDLALLIFICIFLPIYIFSDEIVSLLYGERFALSGQILSVHIACGFLIASGEVRASWILSENLQRYEIPIHLIGAVSNIVFNLICITYYGTIGAAYGTLLAHVFTFFFTALMVKKIRPSFFMTLKGLFNIFTLKFLRKGYLSHDY